MIPTLPSMTGNDMSNPTTDNIKLNSNILDANKFKMKPTYLSLNFFRSSKLLTVTQFNACF